MKKLLYILPFLLLSTPLFAQIELQITPGQPGAKTPQQKPGQPIQRQVKVMNPRAEEQLAVDRVQRTETRGDYEKALQGWQDILSKYSWNADGINGVIRCNILLKHYDDANKFINETIKRGEFREPQPFLEDPTSKFTLTLQLGQVELARGDKDKAWQIWNGALNEHDKNPNAVRSLALILQTQRLWEDCGKLIKDYRKQSKDAGFMAMELANVLRVQMDFTGATEELLIFSRTSPAGWSITMNYLERFPDDSTVIRKVTGVLQKALKIEKDNPELWKIYAGYLLKVGDLDKSLEATITADSISGKDGKLVFQAAQNMLKEGEVNLARHAFERVIKWKPEDEIGQRAEIGLGECLETQGQWTQAKQSYEKFIAKNAGSRAADDAKYKIAEILLTRENKPDSALSFYKGLWIRGLNSPTILRAQIGLRIGDCNAYLGQYAAAISAWQDVMKLVPQGQPSSEDAAQAMLRIARANFWQDSLKAALATLDAITAGSLTSSAFNDAVLYTALLDEGGFHGAVRAFADGDKQMFMNQFSSAADNFAQAAGLIKSGKVAEWARYQEALAYRQAGKPNEAIAALDTFITNFGESTDLDRAVYTRAMIQADDLKDQSGASEAFQKFLLDYPRSMYLEQARRKARILASRVS